MTPWKMTATELRGAFADGTLSPVEAMRSTLERVAVVNPAINALFELRPEAALAAARLSEARWKSKSPIGPLDGVPVTIKDSIAAKGWPYWRGTSARRGTISEDDSPPAARLLEAGAIIFAKTTMPDLGLLPAGVSSAHGVTRNPWNLAMNTGGSSSGAAAAVAAGVGPLSVGSDLAGSVRLPAAHCGIVALKPSNGMVPHMPLSATRVAGPMTRSVADAALLLSVISRPDPRIAGGAGPTGAVIVPADLRGLRIGVLADMGFGEPVQPQVASLFTQAVDLLASAGAEIREIEPPFDADPREDLDRIFAVRAAMERDELPAARRDDMLDHLRRYCEEGSAVAAKDYLRSLERIEHAMAIYLQALSGHDVVLSPVMPVTGFAAEAPGFDPEHPLRHLQFTAMINQVGLPAASVFCGFAADGLPVGLQISGRLRHDVEVLSVAAAYESLRGDGPGFPTL